MSKELKKLGRKISFKGLLKRFADCLTFTFALEFLFNNALLLGITLACLGWLSSKFLNESRNEDISVYRNQYIFDYLDKCEDKMDNTKEKEIIKRTERIKQGFDMLLKVVAILFIIIACIVRGYDLVLDNCASFLLPITFSASYTLILNKIDGLLLKKEIFSKILFKKEEMNEAIMREQYLGKNNDKQKDLGEVKIRKFVCNDDINSRRDRIEYLKETREELIHNSLDKNGNVKRRKR